MVSSAVSKPAGTLSRTSAKTGAVFSSVSKRKEATAIRRETGVEPLPEELEAPAPVVAPTPTLREERIEVAQAERDFFSGIGSPRDVQRARTRELFLREGPEDVGVRTFQAEQQVPLGVQRPEPRRVLQAERIPIVETPAVAGSSGSRLVDRIRRERTATATAVALGGQEVIRKRAEAEEFSEVKTFGEHAKLVGKRFKETKERAKKGSAEFKRERFLVGQQKGEARRRKVDELKEQLKDESLTREQRSDIIQDIGRTQLAVVGSELTGTVRTGFKVSRVLPTERVKVDIIDPTLPPHLQGRGLEVPAFQLTQFSTLRGRARNLRDQRQVVVKEPEKLERIGKEFEEKTGFSLKEAGERASEGLGEAVFAGTTAAVGGSGLGRTAVQTVRQRVVAEAAVGGTLGAINVGGEVARASREGTSLGTAVEIGVAKTAALEVGFRGPGAVVRRQPFKFKSFELETVKGPQTVRVLGEEARGTIVGGTIGRRPFIGSPATRIAKEVKAVRKPQELFFPETRFETRLGKQLVREFPSPKTKPRVETQFLEDVEFIAKGLSRPRRVATPKKDVRPLKAETETLGKESIKAIERESLRARAFEFGSRPSEAQLPEGVIARRRAEFLGKPSKGIGDIDELTRLTKKQAQSLSETQVRIIKTRGTEPLRDVRVSPEEGVGIQSRIKGTREFKTARDIKGPFDEEGPQRAFGESLEFFAIRGRVPTEKGLRTKGIQQIREQPLRKGLSITQVRVREGGFTLGPESKRLKDVPDFLAISEELVTRLPKGRRRAEIETRLQRVRSTAEFKFPKTRRGRVSRESLPRSPSRSIVVPSISPASISKSVSRSVSPSVSKSLSKSLSRSPSVSPSISPSISPSFSRSISPSVSPSISPSLSPSVSRSLVLSPQVPFGALPPILPTPSLKVPKERRGRGVQTRKGFTASLTGILAAARGAGFRKGAPKKAATGFGVRLPVDPAKVIKKLKRKRLRIA